MNDFATRRGARRRRAAVSVMTVTLATIVGAALLVSLSPPDVAAQTPEKGQPPLATSSDGDQIVPGRYLVKLGQFNEAAVEAVARSTGLEAGYRMAGIGWVAMRERPGASLRSFANVNAVISNAPGVMAVEPVRLRTLTGNPPTAVAAVSESALASNDPIIWAQWGLYRTNATDAWEITRGAGVTVAVVDTGVDLTHEDLTGRLVPGFDFADNDSDPTDEDGHGTHVAGTIAATRNNGLGGSGVAPEASIQPVRVCSPLPVGCLTDAIALGIMWATDNGADIINLSLSGAFPSQAVQDAVAYAIANNVVVVAASGNSATAQLEYPAAYPGVIGVGALTPGLGLASFSTTGPHVDLVAPGVEVWSTVPQALFSDAYDEFSGTSMAAPHVAGIAALVRAANPNFTNTEVSARLLATAVDLGAPGLDTSFGAGAVDAYRALTNGSDPSGDYFEIEIDHTFAGDLRVEVAHGGSGARVLFVPSLSQDTSDDDIVVRYSLPPTALASVSGVWQIAVADFFTADVGSITGFRVRSGGVLYSYEGPPVLIPDATGQFVFAQAIAPVPGLLRVPTSPALPTQISVNGVPADDWGLNWVKQPPGGYTVSFSDVKGWSTPAPLVVNVAAGEVTEVTGAFAQRGFLRVITEPPVPSTIDVNGEPANDWGTWTDVPPGSYEVCFGDVADFAAPGCETAVVAAGSTTVVTGTFVANIGSPPPSGHGLLRIETIPSVSSQISIDGVIRTDWGLDWMKLPSGTYTVSFGDVENNRKPPPQEVTIVAGEVTTLTATFELNGLIRVITDPPVPGTITIDGIPRNDWGLWTNVPPGAYQVCFGFVPGFVTPSCQIASVSAGAQTTFTGTYTPIP